MDSSNFKNIIIILFLGTLNFSIQSQQPIYRHFNTSIGMPSGSVYKVFQDSKGVIWFATSRGIARFDGCNLKNFNDNI